MGIAVRKEPMEEPAPLKKVPRLENGDLLVAAEFLQRYESMPSLKKAELIEGTAYMPSPVSTYHSKPDSLIQMVLGLYSVETPGVEYLPNTTVILDPENVPQPDALLRLLPQCAGRTHIDQNGYLAGPPEFIVEIAATTVSIDLHSKMRAYRRAAVREYLVWRTLDRQFDWFVLENDEYRRQSPDAHGLLTSPHFPGLTLALEPLMALDGAKVLHTLQASLQSPQHSEFVAHLAKLASETKPR